MIPPLTEATLREPLRRALAARGTRVPSGAGTAAAVLVPLFERDGEAHVWLALRPTSMRSHAGQVAFPGGKHDATDATLLDTALRETHEELGIPRESVDVLGALDGVVTITGFTISPWVGWLAPGVDVVPNADEVARVFAAPLRAFLEEPAGAMPWRGWTVDGELVWGATAAIVRGFVAILREL
ncbi:MAG TPA: CoA pyrophosphatase [Polyangiaceae bacterium]|nr:CoA pyrophosphatase [Polyangiaceae bacterium]